MHTIERQGDRPLWAGDTLVVSKDMHDGDNGVPGAVCMSGLTGYMTREDMQAVNGHKDARWGRFTRAYYDHGLAVLTSGHSQSAPLGFDTHHEEVINSLDPNRSPAGSSSGAGVLAATGLVVRLPSG